MSRSIIRALLEGDCSKIPDVKAARQALGMDNGEEILNSQHPLVLYCIGAGQGRVVFIPKDSKEESVFMDTSNPVAGEFRNFLG